jgi:hypothetical protein
MLPTMDFKTMALLAIVSGLVVICMGIWYVWNRQQMLGAEVNYIRNQWTTLHQAQNALQASPGGRSTAAASSSTAATSQTAGSASRASQNDDAAADVEEVLHRSFSMADAAASRAAADEAGDEAGGSDDDSDSDDDGDGDDDSDDSHDGGAYDDNDQLVDTADLKDPVAAAAAAAAATAAPTETDANDLVESLLSGLISGTDGSGSVAPSSADADADADADAGADVAGDATATEAVDDGCLHEEGDGEAEPAAGDTDTAGETVSLAETLRKRTVAELKVMCAEHLIDVKIGKAFKRKEVLVADLVEKLAA